MPEIENKDEKCRQIERLILGGTGVCESCRQVGISEKTFYRWRNAKAIDTPQRQSITAKL